MSKSSCAAAERIEDAALRMTRVNCTEIKKKKQASVSDRKLCQKGCSLFLFLAGRRNGERKPLCAGFSFAV